MPIRDATPADAPAIARLHVASWRATYRGLLPDRLLADLSREGRERQWARARSAAAAGRGCVVAADEGAAGLVGFASGGPRRGDWRFDAERFTVYLAQTHQGRGLGRALVGEKCEEMAGASLHEVVYGWPDLGNLQAKTGFTT